MPASSGLPEQNHGDEDAEYSFIMFEDIVRGVLPNIGKTTWTKVFAIEDEYPNSSAIHCALVRPSRVRTVLRSTNWDLSIGDGLPGFWGYPSAAARPKYARYGVESWIRPFVFNRYFHGAFPQYVEFDEEFRLLHNLAEDRTAKQLYDFDDSGNKIVVARYSDSLAEVRTRELSQFLNASGFCLALFFDLARYSSRPYAQTSEYATSRKVRLENSVWQISFGQSHREEYVSISRFLGKFVITPQDAGMPRRYSDFYSASKRYTSFIISSDHLGNEVEYSCNPDNLDDYYGKNEGAPHYVTPVYFRKEVLKKNYNEPEQFVVEDGIIRCHHIWILRIDNDLPDHVMVFLGDLGRDIPYEEQQYWRSYNVWYEGTMSKASFSRNIMAEFADPTSPDLVFRKLYGRFCSEWLEKYSWSLYLPLEIGDAYHLMSFHIPATNSQTEFDGTILSLSKILIDSLNIEELRRVTKTIDKSLRGIGLLEVFLNLHSYEHTSETVELFRSIQALRSTGAAHRKGDEYQKSIRKLNIDLANKTAAIVGLVRQVNDVLDSLMQADFNANG